MGVKLLLFFSSRIAILRSAAVPVVKFGIVTDVHYADSPASGTRHYRDSLPKMQDALRGISSEGADFLIELGDFKDTDASHHCADKAEPTEFCLNTTEHFLREMEHAIENGFAGPRYHVLGNHDVDILTQAQALAEEHNTDDTVHPLISGNVSEGYFSFHAPSPNMLPAGPDTAGCLATDGQYIWIVHDDGTRNWLDHRGSCQVSQALSVVPNAIRAFPKRHGGTGAYDIDASVSGDICETCYACVAGHLPSVSAAAPLRFLVLNGDFTDRDLPWADLDGPSATASGMSWDKANVPTRQVSWLADQLLEASSAGQHVVVFVHYRLDGGLHRPAETPPLLRSDLQDWIDSCTLQNAASVRAVLEAEPGLVLATFSGHDHIPNPPYTQMAGKPAYITLFGMIEGAYAEGRNSYSVVSVLDDCSVFVQGWADQPNITIDGPSECNLKHLVV